MKKRFYESFVAKAKDCGLTDKAIEELAAQGMAGIGDEATEEQVDALADSYAALAKVMQGEVTRKTQEQKDKLTRQHEEAISRLKGERQGGDAGGDDDRYATLARQLQDMVDAFGKQQEEMRRIAEDTARERHDKMIAEKAKAAGIDDELFSMLDKSALDKGGSEAEAFLTRARQLQINLSQPRRKGPAGLMGDGGDKEVERLADSLVRSLG